MTESNFTIPTVDDKENEKDGLGKELLQHKHDFWSAKAKEAKANKDLESARKDSTAAQTNIDKTEKRLASFHQ